MKQFDVAGIGNALLDLQVEVPFDFLEEQGLERGSMTLVDRAQQEEVLTEIKNRFGAQKIKMTSGGCAANTLAGISNFGGTAAFFGRIGTDDHGHRYKESLEHANVTTKFKPGPAATGTCLALITPDAERTMLTHLGISIELGEKDLDLMTIRHASVTHIEGYLWDSPSARAASLAAIEAAHAAGKRVSFTYSDSHCVQRHLKDFVELTKAHVDIVFANESEAKKATGKSDGLEAFRELKNWANFVCVTLGPRGALLSDRSQNLAEHIPTWDVDVVDKLGAGDLFASGFLFGLTQDRSLKESGFLGCFAATKVIQQMSARIEDDLSVLADEAAKGPGEEACLGQPRVKSKEGK